MKKALLYLFVFIAVQFFATWAVYFIFLTANGHEPGEMVQMFAGNAAIPHDTYMMLTASAVCSITLLSLFVWRKWSVVSPAYLRSRQWGVFFWTALATVGTLVPAVWLQEQMAWLPDDMSGTLKEIIGSDYGYFIICIFAPVVEEVIFRGAVLRALLSAFNRHWYAIAVSALVFAVAHLNLAQMPHAFITGLLLGWIYYRTGSVLPGILLHWINNTAAFVMVRLFPETGDTMLADLLGGDQKRVVLSIIFSMFILLPSIYQLNMRMKR